MDASLALYASPFVGSVGNDLDNTIKLCFYLIDKHPADIGVTSQAINGLLHISKSYSQLFPSLLLKLLQVINSSSTYGSDAVECSIRGIGTIVSMDDTFLVSGVQILLSMIDDENSSDFHKSSAFCALSRIGRKYPALQEKLVPTFISHLELKDSQMITKVKEEILIGLARMAQTSAKLKKQIFPIWIEYCASSDYKLKSSAIEGLGHACFVLGNLKHDEILEENCFEIASYILQENIENTENDILYRIQNSVMKCLGFLVRSNFKLWWPKVLPIYLSFLQNSKVTSLVKSSIIKNLGKFVYFQEENSSYLQNIKKFLLNVSSFELDNQVYESVFHSLIILMNCSKQGDNGDIKDLFLKKFGVSKISNASFMVLDNYLKIWCLFVSNVYKPLNENCNTVLSNSTEENIKKEEYETLKQQYNIPNLTESTLTYEKTTEENLVNSLKSDNFESSENGDMDIDIKIIENESFKIACNSVQLYELCSSFSQSVIESIVTLLTDSSMLEASGFLENLLRLIEKYIEADSKYINEEGWKEQYDELSNLQFILRECAVLILNHPNLLQNELWLLSLKLLITTIALDTKTTSQSDENSSKEITDKPINEPENMDFTEEQILDLEAQIDSVINSDTETDNVESDKVESDNSESNIGKKRKISELDPPIQEERSPKKPKIDEKEKSPKIQKIMAPKPSSEPEMDIPDDRLPCQFFYNNNCKNRNCPFAHSGKPPPRKAELCKFFASGKCKNGERCLFRHERTTCKQFLNGRCRSKNCLNYHDLDLKREQERQDRRTSSDRYSRDRERDRDRERSRDIDRERERREREKEKERKRKEKENRVVRFIAPPSRIMKAKTKYEPMITKSRAVQSPKPKQPKNPKREMSNELSPQLPTPARPPPRGPPAALKPAPQPAPQPESWGSW